MKFVIISRGDPCDRPKEGEYKIRPYGYFRNVHDRGWGFGHFQQNVYGSMLNPSSRLRN